MFDSFLDEIEEDLKSVWSSNKSERESAIFSAERSAEADANGLATDLSGATGSSLSVSSDGSVSSDSSDDSSQTIDLDHEHANFKFCMTSSCSSSSESFELVKPFDFFANNNTDDSENDGTVGTSIELLDADGNRPEDS